MADGPRRTHPRHSLNRSAWRPVAIDLASAPPGGVEVAWGGGDLDRLLQHDTVVLPEDADAREKLEREREKIAEQRSELDHREDELRAEAAERIEERRRKLGTAT